MQPSGPDAAGDSRHDRIWIVALVALAALLRAPGLDAGLWVDEIFTLLDYTRRPLAEVVTSFPSNNNHPLYSLLANLSVTAFGEHAWSLRLPAFVFGVAAVPLVFALGRRVVTRPEALIAAGLAAVAYHLVWFSQNARGYTALLAFTLLSTHWLLRGLDEGRLRFFAGYGVAAALGAYTHLTMGFVIAAQGLVAGGLWLVPGGRAAPRFGALALGFGLAGGLSLLAYLPLLADAQAFFASSGDGGGWRGTATLAWALGEIARGFGMGVVAALALAVAAAVGAAGAWSLARERPVALALFVAPVVLTTAGALAMGRPIFPRFYLFAAGFALLVGVRSVFVLGGLAARALGRPLAAPRLAIGACAAAVALGLATAPLAWGPKQDFEAALAYLQQREREGARVAVAGIARVPFWKLHGQDWPRAESADGLRALAAARRPLLLTYAFPWYIEAEAPELMAEIDARCVPERVFTGSLRGGAIHVCRVGEG